MSTVIELCSWCGHEMPPRAARGRPKEVHGLCGQERSNALSNARRKKQCACCGEPALSGRCERCRRLGYKPVKA